MKLFSAKALPPLLASNALGGTGGGCAKVAEGGLLMPLVEPVLRFNKLPFSCKQNYSVSFINIKGKPGKVK